MSRIKLGEPGWVYILSNATIRDGDKVPLLKIGATTRSPEERAKQLSAATAAATAFHVLYSREVPDVNAAEAAMHRALSDHRVNDGREFFRISLLEAARTLDILCGETLSRLDPPTPYADLFATFDPDGPDELIADEQVQCRELARKLGQ